MVACSAKHRPTEEGDARNRHDPPGRDIGRSGRGGRGEGDHHAKGRLPVVAYEKAPDSAKDGRYEPHAASIAPARRRRRRSPSIASALMPITRTRIGRADSPPGQRAPAPSAPQKIPKEVRMTPTAKLIAFSGTRGSGGAV